MIRGKLIQYIIQPALASISQRIRPRFGAPVPGDGLTARLLLNAMRFSELKKLIHRP